MENVTRLGNSPLDIFVSAIDYADKSEFPTTVVAVCCAVGFFFVVLVVLLCLWFRRGSCLLRFARGPGGAFLAEIQVIGPQVGPINAPIVAAGTTWV